MADDKGLYVPWYEADVEGLHELTQIKQFVDQLAGEPNTDD